MTVGAWHYLNTDQTGYWVDPEEHISRLLDRPEHLHDRNLGESGEEMFHRKGVESMQPADSGVHGAGLYDAIVNRDENIREPVSMHFTPRMTSPQLLDGYHRSAVAALKQKMTGEQVRLPVTYLGGGDALPSRSGARSTVPLEQSRWKGRHSYEDDPDD